MEEADRVLAQVARAYRNFSSYSDRGFIESLEDPDSAEWAITLRFSTHFRRPNLFRFEWSHSDLKGVNVIWYDGKSAFARHRNDTKAARVESLGLAIAGATGVSGGTSHNTSSLLMAEVGGRKLIDMKSSEYRGTETVNNEACHHLQQAGGERQIFISKSNATILRIDEDYVIAAGSTEKLLRSTRFRSFSLFMHWLQYVIDNLGSEREEDLRVVKRTIYEQVVLNPELSDEHFSAEGAGQRN